MFGLFRQEVAGSVQTLRSYVRLRKLCANHEEVRHVSRSDRAHGSHDCMQWRIR